MPAEQVDPIYFNKSYYLEPDAHGLKPYVLLRDALEESDRVAVVKVALRQRESLATLRVREGVLVLETMLWPDEIRTRPTSASSTRTSTIRPQELTMAESLIETMTADFDPAQFTDEYREALEAVIDAKIEGREVVAPKEPKAKGEVVDLMAALQASVESARKAATGLGGDERPESPGRQEGERWRQAGSGEHGEARAAAQAGREGEPRPSQEDGLTQPRTEGQPGRQGGSGRCDTQGCGGLHRC